MALPQKAVLALSGGVGGAKLALGLDTILPPGQLHVLVNTGDDFEHLGLHISPDIDTLLYTLSGQANAELGWGLAGETWQTMEALARLGGETWFRLGDRDMATHLWRTRQLALGRSLGEVTMELARRMGLHTVIHPMSDDPVRTTVQTAGGALPFQHYFVREQCRPAVSGFSFAGVSTARPNHSIMRMLEDNAFACIVVCPSNPFVSIDPILQVPGLWPALRDSAAPVILVSPIVAGTAIKGPAAKMMAELEVPVTAPGVAGHYASRYPGLLDYFVIDESDATLAHDIKELGIEVTIAATVMKTLEDRQHLADVTLQVAAQVAQ